MTKKKYLLVSLVSILVLAVGVSVAYFTVQIEGTGKTMSVNTANLRVIFTDTNAAIDATDIKPGWEASKTFTVESQTDAAYEFDIVIKDLVNTFVTKGFLQYQIIRNGNTVKDWTDIPKNPTATDTVLVHAENLPIGVTHSYRINFRYQNSAAVDQSVDMGKVLSGSIMIKEGATDDFIVSYTYKGSSDNILSYNTYLQGLGTTYQINSTSCSSGTSATMNETHDNIVFETTSLPATCTIDFGDLVTYTVSIQCSNCSYSKTVVVEESYNSATFNTDFLIASLSCDDPDIEITDFYTLGRKFTLSNITKNATCTIAED